MGETTGVEPSGGEYSGHQMQDPTNSAFTMNVVVIVKNTKTQLFSGRNEEGKCVVYNI